MDFFQSIFKVLNENIVLMIVAIIVVALSSFSILYVIIDKIRNRHKPEQKSEETIWNRNFEVEYSTEKQEKQLAPVSLPKETEETREIKQRSISVILPREHKKEVRNTEPVLASVPEATIEARKNALLGKEEPTIVVKEFVLEENIQDFASPQIIDPTVQPSNKDRILKRAMLNRQYVSFVYENKPVLMQPEIISDTSIAGFCYIANEHREFELSGISHPALRISPFQVQATGPAVGIGRIREIINTAIQQNKHLRLTYTNQDDTELIVLSARRIAFNSKAEYIVATLDKLEDQRTFQFDRISEIAILNL